MYTYIHTYGKEKMPGVGKSRDFSSDNDQQLTNFSFSYIQT